MAISRQLVQEYLWKRAVTLRYAVSAALFPASSAAASVASAFEAMYGGSGDHIFHAAGEETFEAVKMLRAAFRVWSPRARL